MHIRMCHEYRVQLTYSNYISTIYIYVHTHIHISCRGQYHLNI